MDSLQRSLAKENFHILGKQMGKEQGEVCAGCVKEEEKEKSWRKGRTKGKKGYGTW